MIFSWVTEAEYRGCGDASSAPSTQFPPAPAVGTRQPEGTIPKLCCRGWDASRGKLPPLLFPKEKRRI